MDVVTRKITYQGSAARASALVQMLEREGVRVEWMPLREERSFGADANAVLVNLISTGTIVAIAAGVRRFRKWAPRCKVEVEGERPGGDESKTEHPNSEEPRPS
jgi:hypothetical protein